MIVHNTVSKSILTVSYLTFVVVVEAEELVALVDVEAEGKCLFFSSGSVKLVTRCQSLTKYFSYASYEKLGVEAEGKFC